MRRWCDLIFAPLFSFFMVHLAQATVFTAEESEVLSNSNIPAVVPAILTRNHYPVSVDQEQVWRENGFLLIDGLFDRDFIQQARRASGELFARKSSVIRDFGGISFPFKKDVLNQIPLEARLLKIVMKLLRNDHVILKQAELWAKEGSATQWDENGPDHNVNQRMHMDYPNHNVIHPPKWENPDLVSAIVYLDDWSQSGGGTALVPRKGPRDPNYIWPYFQMPGVKEIPYINDLFHAESFLKLNYPNTFLFRMNLYKNQVEARYRPGSVLLYRHDVWHRGTPIKAGETRHVVNLTYSLPNRLNIHHWGHGAAKMMYENPGEGKVEELFKSLILSKEGGLDALAVLGVPRPEDPYWEENPEAYELFLERYLGNTEQVKELLKFRFQYQVKQFVSKL